MEVKLKYPLKGLVRRAMLGDYDEFQLRELYRLFVTLARQLVRRKISTGKLNPGFIGISEADIAHDCIAELFTRSTRNELIEIAKYFEHQQLDMESLQEEQILIHIRRLIFTAVNDNIFRIYNEIDPPLGKIIRNIKNAVNRDQEFQLTNRFGEQFLEIVSTDPLRHLATPSDGDIRILVDSIMATEEEIPSILLKLKCAFVSQSNCRRSVRLVSLALAIRKGYELVSSESRAAGNEVTPDVDAIDIRSAIQVTCEEISRKIKDKYCKSGKIDNQTYECYSFALRRMLEDEFINGSDGTISYYEYVSQFLPQLTKVTYQRHHRTTFEYLAKLSKEAVRKRLKET